MGKVAKQWKSDGEEDKKLHTLIMKGKVNKHTTPKELQRDFPDVFGPFSLQVMRNHLNAAKRANGLYLDTEDDDVEVVEVEEAKDTDNSSGPSIKFESTFDGVATVHLNYPTIIKIYTCPETHTEKVLVVASLPGGVQGVKVELHEDGVGVSIKYSWPKPMYNVDDLFRKKLQIPGFNEYHPMILGFQSGLEQVRKKIDLAPEGLVRLVLPRKVQTAIVSWEKWGAKREDGSHIILAVFSCFTKDYVKRVSDQCVLYD